MLGNDYPEQVCSVARALEVIGERWTLLIIRDAFLGVETFDELVDSLGITRTVLARRLAHLVEHGVLDRRRYHQRPDRHSYHLTPKGQELFGVIVVLTDWGDRHYPHPPGPPRLIRHHGCGGSVSAQLTCTDCYQRMERGDIEAVPGPGLLAAPGDRPDDRR